MDAILNGPGFLGMTAPFGSDATLILMLVCAVIFTIGWRLAVRGRYEAHRWVQTSAVILSTFGILVMMVRSYITYILPGIPSKLGEGSYALTTLHALIGLIAMGLGIYLVLEGNNLLPKRLRLKEYRRPMRLAYILYMLSTLGGVILYVVVFVFNI